MIKRISQTRWFKYLIETLYITFLLGLCFGTVLGLVKDWNYASKGIPLPTLDTLKFSINESIFVLFLFFFLYLLVFLALRPVIKDTKWTCFLAGTVSCFPLFLFLGYRIDQANRIHWSNFFEREAIIFNSKVGIGFILLWVLVSIGLFFWTGSRILKTQPVNIRGLSTFLGIVLVFNISMFLVHRLHTTNSPSVIILLVDCLRADHLRSYGYTRNTTPNIDEFSKDAVMFTQAISQSTFTQTSIASLFTSRYPHQHGVYAGNLKDRSNNITSDVLSEEETTLAEVLSQSGFLTVAWIYQVHLASYAGFAQGFVGYHEWAGNILNINKKFIKWAKRKGKRHKFFAYIHYLDLHDPYRPKPPYDTMYGVYSNVYTASALENPDRFISQVQQKRIKLEKKDVDQLIAYYDGLVTYIDSEIGLLLEELKNSGLYDNAMIILTADHGDGFMEHDFISHSNTPYDELIRVPLIIKFPNSLYGGKVVKSQVKLIDVMPTVVDFLEIKTNSKLSGFSLLNYLDDNENKDSKIDFPQHAYSEYDTTLSIRTEKIKYIHFQDKKDEFYDLSVDPLEQNNIIDLQPDEAEKFHRMALGAVSEREKKEVERVILDKKTIEELKALGYLQ